MAISPNTTRSRDSLVDKRSRSSSLPHSAKPQVLILDEPTNFLDRDALGGLAVAIKNWAGAFVCISHNAEFVGALCPEIWNVEAGRLIHKGKAAVVEDAFEEMAA